MPRSKKNIDWDAVAAAYTEGALTLKQIGEQFGVTAGAISQRAKREGWPARKRVSVRQRKPGAAFEWRLARALDRQIAELEDRWSDEDMLGDAANAEKEARTLNVLIRTAEKLKELEMNTQTRSGTSGDQSDKKAERLDRKRLRETLERRLDKLIAAADAHGLPREPDGKRA